MNTTHRRNLLSFPSRLTLAGLVVMSSGMAVSMAAETATANESSQRTPAKRSVSKADSKSTNTAPAKTSKAKSPRRGTVHVPMVSRDMPLRDPTMSPSAAYREIMRRAELISQGRDTGGVIAPKTPGHEGQGGSGQGVLVMPNDGNGTKIDIHPNPGDWPFDDGPGMGEGIRNCMTPLAADNYPSENRGFVITTNLWGAIPLPAGAPDVDGDGEADNPIPNNPVVIYYQFLEDNMTEIDWESGDDNFNLIALPTEDTDADGIPDAIVPGDTDGLADTWPQGTTLHILPPPDPDVQVDPFLSTALVAMGLGQLPWGDDRPVFDHPDEEAAYYLAQREYVDTEGFTFQDTFSGGQVPDVDVMRPVIIAAMQAISEVCNVIFIKRSNDRSNFNAGYPFAPTGYPFDPSVRTVNSGAFFGGLPGDVPFDPTDDYPWILIVQGSGDRVGSGGNNFATRLGVARGPGIEVDYSSQGAGPFVTDDINNDGFPDLVDLNGDGFTDQIMLSNIGIPIANPVNSALDLNSSGGVDATDSSFSRLFATSPGTIPWPDLNGDGTADFLLDPNDEPGNVGNVVDMFGIFGGTPLSIDLGIPGGPGSLGDFVADNVTGTGGASPPPIPFEPIPCELLNITDASIAVAVHEIMHHMGFMHEHQRPDRDEFIRVNFQNIEATDITQFTRIPGGTQMYANYVDNFDTTLANGTWTFGAAPADGQWQIAVPVDAGAGDPPLDYAVDADDVSTMCAVTGNGVGKDVDGVAMLITPQVFGPEGTMVEFAYWLNSDGAATLPDGDGLFVDISGDAGATWEAVWSTAVTSDEWRVQQLFITDLQEGNEFLVRFKARDVNADNLVEAGIDRLRVQNEYDFRSIMHYGPFAFSANGAEVIEVREEFQEFETLIGIGSGLSAGDRAALQNLYGQRPPPDDLVGDDDPCRADTTGDGLINGQDIVQFLEWYNSEDIRADFAAPAGVIDVLDLVRFFVDFQLSFECFSDNPPNILGGNNLDPIDPR